MDFTFDDINKVFVFWKEVAKNQPNIGASSRDKVKNQMGKRMNLSRRHFVFCSRLMRSIHALSRYTTQISRFTVNRIENIELSDT